tara:strand:+ start:129 stop:335 length:207 start_codon:yes stop_codon:yes gene_type:complete
MDVKKIQEKKLKLSEDIKSLLTTFHNETSIRIQNIGAYGIYPEGCTIIQRYPVEIHLVNPFKEDHSNE